MTYFWVALGSALGGLARYAITRLMLEYSTDLPWGTILINVAGCFIIGLFGTLTVSNGRFAASDEMRMFVMVGICGGFTTFSSFSLQTFDLVRSGAWMRASGNVLLSVVLCFFSVAFGHLLAQHWVDRTATAETRAEKLTG